MYGLKKAGTDQVSFGPVTILNVVKIIWSTALSILFGLFYTKKKKLSQYRHCVQ